jgi:hypothetical protein
MGRCDSHINSIYEARLLTLCSITPGIRSVLPTDARYTVNDSTKAWHIGVKNNLQFNIYVLVLSSEAGAADLQYTMRPGKVDFWRRQDSEVVLVSVGGAPGAPRAFQGKVGSTLHIDRL